MRMKKTPLAKTDKFDIIFLHTFSLVFARANERNNA
jgi:hypothetical protein